MQNTSYKNKFINEKYDRINFTVPKGTKEIIKSHCDRLGISVNSYIYELIRKDLSLKTSKSSEKNKDMDIFLF